MKEDITKNVVVGQKVKCDICLRQVVIVKNDSFETKDGKIHICKSCCSSLPQDVLDALDEDQTTWRYNAAYFLVYSIREEDDIFDYKTDTFDDMNVGIWGAYGINCDSEDSRVRKFDSMEEFKRATIDYRCTYDEWSYELMTAIIDGKLRQFKIESSVVEVIENEGQ